MTISYDDLAAWAEAVEDQWTRHKVSIWRMADMVNQGLAQFAGSDRKARHALLSDLAEQIGLAPKTIENYVRIAEAFPEQARHLDLTIHHHEVVLTMGEGDRALWLRLAAENLWSVEKLRHEVRVREEPDEPVPLPHADAIEKLFYAAGVRARLTGKRATFTTSLGSLVVESDSDLRWSALN